MIYRTTYLSVIQYHLMLFSICLQTKQLYLAPNANPENFVVTFHNSEEDAENDDTPIPNPSSYVGLDEEVIFLRFEYLDSNCFEIETFQLILLDAPEIFPTNDLVLCDDY